MAGIRKDIDRIPQSNTFDFSGLPPELRTMVYHHIILPRHKQTPKERHSSITPEDEHYYEQRRICHQTAKSLMLTCKEINRETTELFYNQKSVLVCKPGLEAKTLRRTNHKMYFIRAMRLDQIRHIEFNIRCTQVDAMESFPMLRHNFMVSNIWLGNNLRRLPRLKTITFRLAQDIESPADVRKIRVELFDIKHTDRAREIAIVLPENSAWGFRQPYRPEDIKYMLKEAGPIYQYADQLGYSILPRRKWACTKTLHGSFLVAGFDSFLHELKFERGAYQVNGYENWDDEEDAGSDTSCVTMGWDLESDVESEKEVENTNFMLNILNNYDHDMVEDED